MIDTIIRQHLDQHLGPHDTAEVRLIHSMLTRAGFAMETFPLYGEWKQGESWVELLMKFRMEDNRFPPAIEETMGKFGYKLHEQGIKSIYATMERKHLSVFWRFVGTFDPRQQ